LIVRGFRAIQNSDSRYRPDSLLTMVLTLPTTSYGTDVQRVAFINRALTQLSALPGAAGAAETTIVPHTIGNSNTDFVMQGRPWQNAGEARTADLEIISPNYFHLMGVPIIEGREFTEADASGNAEVAMISQSLARTYWPKESPIGHGIKFGHYESKYPWAVIVGVVADVKMDWSDVSPSLAVYRPYRQISRSYVSFLLRTGGTPEGMVGETRMAFAGIDPEISLIDLKPMREVIKESTFSISYVAAMMGALGILSLVLAALGVYGVLAYSVAESTNEIGIRMAMGALPRDVLRLVLRRGMILAVAGLAMGLPIAYSLARVLAGLIPGIGKPDPLTLLGIAAVLMAAALLACWLPARRATRTDPITALRYE
jgi:putative ABC transport system permease protein